MNRRKVLLGGLAAVAAGGAAAWAVSRQMGSMAGYDQAVAALRAPMAGADLAELIRYATLAANSHNTQAWSFHATADAITLSPDLSRRTPVVDPDNHHLFVSLGCAAENLSLAAAAVGRAGEVTFNPAGGSTVNFAMGRGQGTDQGLFEAIPLRQSTRTLYDASPVTAQELADLAAAAQVPGVDVVLLTERVQINAVRDLVVAGATAQMQDPAFVAEVKHWLRFSPRRALATADGLFSACNGAPALPEWLGPLVLNMVFTAKAEAAKYASQIDSSSGIAVFVAARDDAAHWVLAGRACQRFALRATALGMKHAFVNQPAEVAGLRGDLAGLVGLSGRRPDIVMRFGRGPAAAFSARRPVSDVTI